MELILKKIPTSTTVVTMDVFLGLLIAPESPVPHTEIDQYGRSSSPTISIFSLHVFVQQGAQIKYRFLSWATAPLEIIILAWGTGYSWAINRYETRLFDGTNSPPYGRKIMIWRQEILPHGHDFQLWCGICNLPTANLHFFSFVRQHFSQVPLSLTSCT